MKLIFSQGNPGSQYARTRHNAGFMMLDQLSEAHQATWKSESKFSADIATVSIAGEKTLLVKPRSFYNETGQVARAIVDFYKLTPADDVLVIHDELALPFGTIRARQKGSDAGNNGIKSLNAHLGDTYWRLRIGIWNEQRDLMDDANFVLSAFSTEEHKLLTTEVFEHLNDAINAFCAGTLDAYSKKINS